MAYTVKQLSSMSSVSIRGLHYYEEIGLLEPSYYGSNGYRYYEKEQLLQLQQILFFKELGFTLKQIKSVLDKSDFDQLKALYAHKHRTKSELKRLKELCVTIDRTIQDLKGEKAMDSKQMYGGFLTKEKQEEYETYLEARWGKEHPAMMETKQNVKDWNMDDWKEKMEPIDQIMLNLATLMKQNAKDDSTKVQEVIHSHYEWLKNFWTPNRESYTLLGTTYQEFEWKAFFAKYDDSHPKLATYMASAMKVYADANLS